MKGSKSIAKSLEMTEQKGIFLKKNPYMSLWKSKMQLRQHCGKMLAKSMKKTSSESAQGKTLFLKFYEYTINSPAFKDTEAVERKNVQKPKMPAKLNFKTKSEKLIVHTQIAVVLADTLTPKIPKCFARSW